ncbi:hypothetical protein QOT17_024726 [Balamuthia mandrillaris]
MHPGIISMALPLHTVGAYFSFFASYLVDSKNDEQQRMDLNKLNHLKQRAEETWNRKIADDGEHACGICLEHVLDLLMVPCRHAVCRGCFLGWSRPVCPYCRARIEQLKDSEEGLEPYNPISEAKSEQCCTIEEEPKERADIQQERNTNDSAWYYWCE